MSGFPFKTGVEATWGVQPQGPTMQETCSDCGLTDGAHTVLCPRIFSRPAGETGESEIERVQERMGLKDNGPHHRSKP